VAIIANRYLKAGGLMIEIFNSFYVLEKFYPLNLLRNTTIELHHCGEGRFEKYYYDLNYFTLWCPENILCLLKDKYDWFQHWDRNSDHSSLPYFKYDASWDSHIAFTIAHEWGHLAEKDYNEPFYASLPNNFIRRFRNWSEYNADNFAQSFIDRHLQDILDLNQKPKIFQQAYDSLGGQLVFSFNPMIC